MLIQAYEEFQSEIGIEWNQYVILIVYLTGIRK
jgi:hypothetical protein